MNWRNVSSSVHENIFDIDFPKHFSRRSQHTEPWSDLQGKLFSTRASDGEWQVRLAVWKTVLLLTFHFLYQITISNGATHVSSIPTSAADAESQPRDEKSRRSHKKFNDTKNFYRIDVGEKCFFFRAYPNPQKVAPKQPKMPLCRWVKMPFFVCGFTFTFSARFSSTHRLSTHRENTKKAANTTKRLTLTQCHTHKHN